MCVFLHTPPELWEHFLCSFGIRMLTSKFYSSRSSLGFLNIDTNKIKRIVSRVHTCSRVLCPMSLCLRVRAALVIWIWLRTREVTICTDKPEGCHPSLLPAGLWTQILRQNSHTSVITNFTIGIIPVQSSLPCRSCGQTRPGRDSWRELCSQRWRCFGQAGSEPPTCRSWLAHPGTHVAPGMDASWVGRRTRPAPKALILAWECYSNQTRGRGFLDPEWQILSRSLTQKRK